MKLINLTPHDITLALETGEQTIPSSGVARLATEDSYLTDATGVYMDGIPVALRRFTRVTVEYPIHGTGVRSSDWTGFPVQGEWTRVPGGPVCHAVCYVVSMPLAQHLNALGRDDVFAPDTGETAIRWTIEDVPDRPSGIFESSSPCPEDSDDPSHAEWLAWQRAATEYRAARQRVGQIRAVRGLVQFPAEERCEWKAEAATTAEMDKLLSAMGSEER